MKINLKLGLVLGLSFFGLSFIYGQVETTTVPNKIVWMSFPEAVNQAQKDQEKRKPLFIDVYTDWCGWCKKMDQTTFADPKIAAYINANFYPVKVDAEMKETIIFNNDTMAFIPDMGRRGTHMLAARLLGGNMSYPTYVVLNQNFNMVEQIKGYKDVQSLITKLESLIKN